MITHYKESNFECNQERISLYGEKRYPKLPTISNYEGCHQIKADQAVLAHLIHSLQMLQKNINNIQSEDFFQSLETIFTTTKLYFFEDFNLFLEYSLFPICFNFSFTQNECNFLQSRSLNILYNFVKSPIVWYSDHFYQMEILQRFKDLLLNSEEEFVINKVIKILIVFASINLPMAQDVLSLISIELIFQISQRVHNKSLEISHEHRIQINIQRLTYLLSRCDTNEVVNIFINYILFCLHEIPFLYKFSNLYIVQFLIKDKDVALLFSRIPQFVELLNIALQDSEMMEPALACVMLIHYYCDTCIENLEYKLIIESITHSEQDYAILAIGVIRNILTHSTLIDYFINNFPILELLIIARSIGNFEVKHECIVVITNAIISSSRANYKVFIKAGCIKELLNALEIDKPDTLYGVTQSLDLLLSEAIIDKKGINIVEEEFFQNFDPEVFFKIRECEDHKVVNQAAALFNHYPQFFNYQMGANEMA